jgi:hypothetical protein
MVISRIPINYNKIIIEKALVKKNCISEMLNMDFVNVHTTRGGEKQAANPLVTDWPR